MKTFKKTSWALLLLAIFGGYFALASPYKALASGPTITVGSFNFIDQYHIQGTIDGQTMSFFDKDPTDPIPNYAPENTTQLNQLGLYQGQIKYWGINLDKGFNFTSKNISGSLVFGYQVTKGNSVTYITVPSQNYLPSDKISIDNSSNNAAAAYRWDGAGDIVSASGSPTYQPAANTSNVFIDQTNNSECEASGLIITSGTNSRVLYKFVGYANSPRKPNTGTPVPDVASQYLQNPSSCRLADSPTNVNILGNAPVAVTSSGRITCDPTADSSCHCDEVGGLKICASSSPQNTPSNNQSCETNFKHSFSFIMCPAMSLADDAAGQFNEFIDEQLCFKTTPGAADKNNLSTSGQTSSTGSGIICQGNNNLTANVKQAWNIFKNIASALIVIALLVMVISQAFGGGPFDAYTIRKLLPKLVAAVIIMQLSWILMKWAIDITNDVGTAIESLIMAPFGGTAHLTLKSLVGYDLSVQSGVTSAAAFGTVFFAALAASVIVSVPTLFMMALYVVLALFTAFVVLLFRKLLIILLVILAPVALVLWVVPGTDRYWKMWRENFTKLLVMFPMITGMIAAGRVFAYIASGNGAASGSFFQAHLAIAHLGPLPVPVFGTFTNFIDLVIIIGAWFAPYFLLPQTYKWGGTALGSITNGVNKAVEKGAHPAKEYLKFRQGLSPWKQAREARKAEVTRKAKLDFARGLNSGGVWQGVRRARLAGPRIPTPKGIREERQLRQTIARSAEERVRQEELKEQGLELASERVDDAAITLDGRLAGVRGQRYAELSREDKLRFLRAHAMNEHTEPIKRELLLSEMANLRGGGELMEVRNWMFANSTNEHNYAADYNRAMQSNFDAFNSTSAMFTQGATQQVVEAARRGDWDEVSRLDLDYMGSQNDQTIATQSGSGWNLLHDTALARDNGIGYEQLAANRRTAGQAAAAAPLPGETRDQARRRGEQNYMAGLARGAQFSNAEGTYRRILTSGQPYAGSINPNGHNLFAGGPPPAPAPPTPGPNINTLGDAELIQLYNTTPNSPLRTAAETELRNRGHIS